MKRTQVILKTLLATVAVLALLFGVFQFLTSSLFRIVDVQIVLTNQASHSVLFHKIQESLDTRLSKYEGRYVWGVDLGQILDEVAQDLRVKNVDVTRQLPNKIFVKIEPYTPLLNIVTNNKKILYPVSRDGEVLPSVSSLEAIDSPILIGEIFLKDRELRLKAVELTLALPETGSISYRSVAEIRYDKKNGFQLQLQSLSTFVWIGFDDFETRIHRSHRVADYLQNEQLTDRIIDARYSKKVVVRLRNEP
jgi:cell division septal protein FtsQ